MLASIIKGLILGLAFLAPIGMQNLYVINSALRMKKMRAYQVALITVLFDISLVLACFFGIGVLIEHYPFIRLLVLLIGGILITFIGVQLIASSPKASNDVDINKSLWRIIIMVFSVTWLNPQAVIEGSLLLGGIKSSLSWEESRIFLVGVCLASFVWFTGITTLVSSFRRFINNKVLRIMNIICGGVIIYFGLKFAYHFIELITGSS